MDLSNQVIFTYDDCSHRQPFARLIILISFFCSVEKRGKKGPIPIQTTNPPFISNFKKAAEELGYKYADPNGPQMEGENKIRLSIYLVNIA